MIEYTVKNRIDSSVQFMKKHAKLEESTLTNFFLIYTISFCSKYINIRSWFRTIENIDLSELKDEAKNKLNYLLFEKLDTNDEEIINYIKWIKSNEPTYTSEDVLGSIYMLTLEKSKRKQLGEHYTRRDLVQFIIDDVLPSNFHEKKIIDPACGSGNFLISILSKALNNKTEHERERVIERLKSLQFLIGVDIQELPCVVTKLRMLMEIMHHHRKVDPTFDYPVFQLDSLMSTDELLERCSYDIVITNPPYLRYQLIEKNKRMIYKEKYKSAVGRFDLYTMFIEKGIDLAFKNGKIVILCSDKFMVSDYGKGVREFINDNAKLVKVTDVNSVYPFEAAVLSSIYKFEKVKSKKNENAVLLKAYFVNGEITNEILGHVVIGDSWRYMDANSEETFNKIVLNSNLLLKDIISRITVGIQTTADKVYCKSMTHSFVNENKFEKQLIVPLLRGRNLKKWTYEWNGLECKKDTYVLYPYTIKEGATVPINLSEFPNVEIYLNKHKEELEKRPYFVGNSKKWFEHWTAHSFKFFKETKILTPDLASKCSFSLDTKGYFYNGTGYSIVLKDEFNISDYKYILGLLNSKVIDYFHKKVSPTHLNSKKYRFQSPTMKKYPMRILDREDPRYLEIVDLVSKIIRGKKGVSAFENRINDIVFQIYGLEENDIRLIELCI